MIWSILPHYYMASVTPTAATTRLAFFGRPLTPVLVRAQFCDGRDINRTSGRRGRKTLALEHSRTTDSETASRDHGEAERETQISLPPKFKQLKLCVSVVGGNQDWDQRRAEKRGQVEN